MTLLSPIVGEFANDDEARPMNFIPPYAERLLELATAGKFPLPLCCEIHVGSEDWQSYPNAIAFGKMVGMKVNVVQGAGMDCRRRTLVISWINGLSRSLARCLYVAYRN